MTYESIDNQYNIKDFCYKLENEIINTDVNLKQNKYPYLKPSDENILITLEKNIDTLKNAF